ncbi:hypothetical protein M409DRAFT_17535 [Zasmidium cellare ATCC 36951]|uniref:Uncharacterized protein n=1 Tax=Zasmidium cellare ATCC 36951 TaxID=1080233 RepID=A0A6A6D1I2_ZASCE|nr:uncharacterized protein M409DRAFT_17535 [Zasmidium cellare ATCC 36951]KAF2172300.1 hypothetical protein M409DRAFT_17535 [Zasmidium cellare ATCC 36951]
MDHMDGKTLRAFCLRAFSRVEYLPVDTKYDGPPIGYAAKVVQHTTPGGAVTTNTVGNPLAPRPTYYVKCEKLDCKQCSATSASNKKSASASSAGTVVCGMDVKCTDKVDEKVDEKFV